MPPPAYASVGKLATRASPRARRKSANSSAITWPTLQGSARLRPPMQNQRIDAGRTEITEQSGGHRHGPARDVDVVDQQDRPRRYGSIGPNEEARTDRRHPLT